MTNKEYKIQNNAFVRIHSIPIIDNETIYCSDPYQYEQNCGIIRAGLSLGTELHNNLATDVATKEVQPTHVKLTGDLLTQSGKLTSFTRNSYRKDDTRSIIPLIQFEQGWLFLQLETMNP